MAIQDENIGSKEVWNLVLYKRVIDFKAMHSGLFHIMKNELT